MYSGMAVPKPLVTDLDEWYHHVLGSMPDYSLIKDEMISEERGHKNVFRRNHKGRSSSPKGVRLKLETISHGSDHHHREVPIQERRQIFSGILVDRKTSSLEIEKYIRETAALDFPVHDEIWAALLFTAGPAKFANLVLDFTHFDSINSINEEYEQRLEKGFLEHLSQDYFSDYYNLSKQKFAYRVDYGKLPIAILLCNLEEAKTVVTTLLRRTNEWLDKLSSVNIDPIINSWKQSNIQSGIGDDGIGVGEPLGHLLVKTIEGARRIRDGEDPFTAEIEMNSDGEGLGESIFDPIQLLFLKFPELYEVASNLGWEIGPSFQFPHERKLKLCFLTRKIS
jgi:hypothetical protein